MSQSAKQEERTVTFQVARKPQLTPELYREIFIHSQEAIAIISPEGRYLEQNGAHYKLLVIPTTNFKDRLLRSTLVKRCLRKLPPNWWRPGHTMGKWLAAPEMEKSGM